MTESHRHTPRPFSHQPASLITGHDSWKQTPCAYTVTRTAPTRATVIIPSLDFAPARGVTTHRRHGFHGACARAWTSARGEGDSRSVSRIFFITVVVKTRAREDDARVKTRRDEDAGDRSIARGSLLIRSNARARSTRWGTRGWVRARGETDDGKNASYFFVFSSQMNVSAKVRARVRTIGTARGRGSLDDADRGRSDVDRSGRSTGRGERASETLFGGRYRWEMDDGACVSRGRAMREDDATDDGWASKRRSPMDNRFPPSPAPR